MKLLFCVLPLLVGCSTLPKQVSSDYLAKMQDRETIEASLLDEQGNLGEEEISRLLNSKIEIPREFHLAVVFLSDSTFFETKYLSPQLERFFDRKEWGGRVQAISPVPQSLLGKSSDLKSLRRAAALLQADMLLVIKPVTRTDWRFSFFRSRAKAISSVEVMLVDTRTSVVPFTVLSSAAIEQSEQEEDFNHSELIERAKLESEYKALEGIPKIVRKFLDSV